LSNEFGRPPSSGSKTASIVRLRAPPPAEGATLDVAHANAQLAELAARIGLEVARPAHSAAETAGTIQVPERPAAAQSRATRARWAHMLDRTRRWRERLPTLQDELLANAAPIAGFACLGFVVTIVVLATAGPQTSLLRPVQTAKANIRLAPIRPTHAADTPIAPKPELPVLLPAIDSVFGSLRPLAVDKRAHNSVAMAPPPVPAADLDAPSAIRDLADHQDWMATVNPPLTSGAPAPAHRAPRGDLRRVAVEDMAKPVKPDLRSLTLPRDLLPDLATGRNH
jgi:hypothetical protein